MRLFRAVAMTALALGGCSPAKQAAPPDPIATAAPELSSLPVVDEARTKAALSADETLQVLTFERIGSVDLKGAVEGYKTKVYAVPVGAAQTLVVTFTPSNTNLYINVSDAAATTGEAVHRGEVDGATATLTPATGTVYLIRPFQPRAMARRGEAGDFGLTVQRR